MPSARAGAGPAVEVAVPTNEAARARCGKSHFLPLPMLLLHRALLCALAQLSASPQCVLSLLCDAA